MACHGANLEGKLGPNLQKVGGKLSEEQIKKQIEAGGGGMPAFGKKLKDNEVDTLVKWLAVKK
jgi:mono/diheme cytochrome c family protein